MMEMGNKGNLQIEFFNDGFEFNYKKGWLFQIVEFN